MIRQGLDFGFKKTTANAVASIHIFTYNFNDNKSIYKLENQIKLVIERLKLTKGLQNPELEIYQSTLVLKYTIIDKL